MKNNKPDTTERKYHTTGRFYTLIRLGTGFSVVAVDVADGLVTNENVGEYDVRKISELVLLRNVAIDLEKANK